jgi:hippurate hydrolase
MAVFQPGEETAQGAQAMIDDGLLKRFPTPNVVLGQHVMVGPAGTVAGSAGPITSAADSLQIRLFGRGAHGSMPQATDHIDLFSPPASRDVLAARLAESVSSFSKAST